MRGCWNGSTDESASTAAANVKRSASSMTGSPSPRFDVRTGIARGSQAIWLCLEDMKREVDRQILEEKSAMYDQEQITKAKINPGRAFDTPMDVVEADHMKASEKFAILKAWEADERALQRAEDEGMGGGEHAHLHKVQAALAHLSKDLCPLGVG